MNIHRAIAQELAKELGAIIYMPVITSDDDSQWYSWTFEHDGSIPKYNVVQGRATNRFKTVYVIIYNGKIGLSDGIKGDFTQIASTYELADPNCIEHIKGYLTHRGIIPVCPISTMP